MCLTPDFEGRPFPVDHLNAEQRIESRLPFQSFEVRAILVTRRDSSLHCHRTLRPHCSDLRDPRVLYLYFLALTMETLLLPDT